MKIAKLIIVTISFVTYANCTDKRIGTSSRQVTEFIKQYLPDNPVILEAGAYNGDDTAVFASVWPQGQVHAFEPVPSLYEKVKTKVAGLENVHVHPVALSDKVGTAAFFVSEHSSNPGAPWGSGSLLTPKPELNRRDRHITFPKKITVNTTTLDTWAKENRISAIDFMWLDMQGHELVALKHAKTILHTVKLIFIEVEFVGVYKDQPLYKDIKHWFATQGFKVLALDFSEQHAKQGKKIPVGQEYYGNALFINKAYARQLGLAD